MLEKISKFRPIATPLDVDDAALDRVNQQLGVPTLTRPATAMEPLPSVPAPAPAQPMRAPLEKLTIELPDYLADALRQDAAARRTTARHIVMLALRNNGYRVDDADLVPDGRRARAKAR